MTTPTTQPTTVDPDQIAHLEITVAHHDDDQFYGLGRVVSGADTHPGRVLHWPGRVVADVTHEASPAQVFAHASDKSCSQAGAATCEHFCIMLDACDANGQIVDNKEISHEIANALLDGAFEERLAEARGVMTDYLGSSRQDFW